MLTLAQIASRRLRQEIDRTASVPHKIALRLDRQFSRRGIRSYCGYEVRGPIFARLNFWTENGRSQIDVDPFGNLRRVAAR